MSNCKCKSRITSTEGYSPIFRTLLVYCGLPEFHRLLCCSLGWLNEDMKSICFSDCEIGYIRIRTPDCEKQGLKLFVKPECKN